MITVTRDNRDNVLEVWLSQQKHLRAMKTGGVEAKSEVIEGRYESAGSALISQGQFDSSLRVV